DSSYDYASAILETIDYLAGVEPAPRLASGIGDAACLRRRFVLILAAQTPARRWRHARRAVLVVGLLLLAVGPKFHRLTASVAQAVLGPAEKVPAGARNATAGNDTVAIVWDATDGRQLHKLTGHWRWVMAVCFSPDGKTLATGGYDKTVRLWNAATGEAKSMLVGDAGGVRAVCF